MCRVNVDHVLVERILSGFAWDLSHVANRDERLAVIRAWLDDDRPIQELETNTGWNVRRTLKQAA